MRNAGGAKVVNCLRTQNFFVAWWGQVAVRRRSQRICTILYRGVVSSALPEYERRKEGRRMFYPIPLVRPRPGEWASARPPPHKAQRNDTPVHMHVFKSNAN